MKLSIITINFNNAAGLQKTMDSVLSQTFADYEYIIIDGGSTDGSVDVIKQYADKLAYWVSEPDKGIYNAHNKGIMQAKGEYCYFLNSADCLLKHDVLEQMFSKNPEEDMIYGDVNWGDQKIKIQPDKLTLLHFFRGVINHQSVFIRRSLFSTYGLYDEKIKFWADKDFFLKALIKGHCTYRHIPLILIRYDLGGISRDPLHNKAFWSEHEKVLKDNFPMMYDDYMELIAFKQSKLITLIRKIQSSSVYKKIRRII